MIEDPAACAKCGACSVVCPVFRIDGRESLTARGKMHLLVGGLAEAPSGLFQDLFSRCLLCGACEDACPRGLALTGIIAKTRARFPRLHGAHPLLKLGARTALAHPRLLEGLVHAGLALRHLHALPRDSGLRLKLDLLDERAPASPPIAPLALGGQGGLTLFLGCHARHLVPSIGRDLHRLLLASGETPVNLAGEVCCGLAARAAGDPQQAHDLARRNLDALARSQGPVVVACASCFAGLRAYPELLADDPDYAAKAAELARRVVEVSCYLLGRLDQVTPRFRVEQPLRLHYHDPCHLRFREGITAPPRRLLAAVKGAQLLDLPEARSCCGHGGLFDLGYPELSAAIFSRLQETVAKAAPDLVLTGCSGCLMQWQAGLARTGGRTKALHLVSFLARALVPPA